MTEKPTNVTLENAKTLLNERFRIDSKDSGEMTQFFRQCQVQLMHTAAELEAQLWQKEQLKLQIAQLEKSLDFFKKHIRDTAVPGEYV